MRELWLWFLALFSSSSSSSGDPSERVPPSLAQKAEALRLALAQDIARLYAGERGESVFLDMSRGLETGRTVGRTVGEAAQSSGIPGAVFEAAGAAFGTIFGALGALIEKENLRARYNDWARGLSPVERYLALALLRPMVDKARERDRLSPQGPWRFKPGGFVTVAGPFSDFPAHFNLESLLETAWPEPPPASPARGKLGALGRHDSRELYIRYALAALGASENDDVRLDHPGNISPPLTAVHRQGAGGVPGVPAQNWLHREWELRGGPTAGAARASALAAGLDDVTDAPLWPELEPAIDAALARRARAQR